MLKFFPNATQKQKIAKKEVGASNFLPYLCHWDRSTILTKDKSLLKVIKVEGFAFETADDDDLETKKNLRNMLFKGLASGSVNIYFHTIRRRVTLDKKNHKKHNPNLKIPADFNDYLQSEWERKYAIKKAYINDLYITIVKKPDKEGAAFFEYLFNQFKGGTNKDSWLKSLKDIADELEEISSRVVSTLSDYGPSLLSVYENKDGVFCQITEFLAQILNFGETRKKLMPSIELDKYLATSRLYFGHKAIECKGPIKDKYAGIISVKEYGPNTYAGALDGFLQMPFEMIVTQSFSFANRQVAIGKMQLQQDRMIQAEDKAVSQIAEISQALDMAMSGDIAFGSHHISIMVMSEDLKELENNISKASSEMFNAGLQPVRETTNLECSFWGQFPDNGSFVVRKSLINSLNLAGFASLHNFAKGQEHGNHWGDHVTILDTTSGTPFYFNFHVRDVGHTLIIGPTGAGKTVLMNFLCGMTQKFRPRMFFFDKDRGAEIFIRAIGGQYTIIDPGKRCGFNPLQLEDTGENRTFLLEWLKVLVSTNGEDISAEDLTVLTQAISGNYKLDKKDRRLRNIVAFLGIEGTGSLANRIAMWHSNGSHASIFDNENDSVDLENFRSFGFEMAELLKDPMSLSPVLIYIFHRINISLDGTPTMIILDEAWALIDNPVFAPKIKDWLKVLRKLNTFVVFATQSVEDAAKSRISDTLIQQTATQIFLPNLKATDVYKSAFMLSQREYEVVKTTDPGSRYFLIKQGVKSIVARVDLSGMTNVINVLSARSETVRLLDRLRAKVGDAPEKWLPVYFDEVKKLN